MTAALHVSGLNAGYGPFTIVRDLELHVDAGEVVALLGSNGAGKTTTLRAIAGQLDDVTGTVELLGAPVRFGRPHAAARRGLAYVPEHRGVFGQLTVAENLRLRAPRWNRQTRDAAVEPFPALRGLLPRRASVLSGGEQQMLALACAFARDPRVLIIDEMSLGLAPIMVERLLPIVRALARDRGVAVLLVEQHVHAALDAADRAYLMRQGELVRQGAAADLIGNASALAEIYLGADAPTQ